MRFVRYILLLIPLYTAVSCKITGNSNQPEKTIELNNSDQDFLSLIKRISLLPLSVDDDWIYMDVPLMTVSDNQIFFLNRKTYHLISYNGQGEKIFCKQIKGRGRGEVLNVGNIFSINDSVCIYDQSTGLVSIYNSSGNYSGNLNSKTIAADVFYPLGKKNYVALSIFGSSITNNHYATIYDKNFNEKEYFLKIPDHLFDLNFQFGNRYLSCQHGDSIRFMLNFDYRIFTVTPDSCSCSYFLKTDNPIPDGLLTDQSLENILHFMADVSKNGYATGFQNLCETSRYIMFNYSVNNKYHLVLLDKQLNKPYSIHLPETVSDDSGQISSSFIWKYILINSVPLCSFRDTIYMTIKKEVLLTLETFRDYLDNGMKNLSDELDQYLSNNKTEEGDNLYFKLEF